MKSEKVKISALAIVYNEELNIRDYLNNISFADEIIVVDSFSTDATPDIIRNEFPHVHFYQRVFDDFSSQRNYTIDLASNDWVMFFDADERITPDGIKEIVSTLNSNPPESAFWVKRIFYYQDKPLVISNFNDDRTARIFRRSKCRYSDKLVHEQLNIDGKSRVLKHAIEHYSFKNKEDFLKKSLLYSRLRAKEFHEAGIRPNWLHFTIRPSYRFFKHYILKLGFLNGYRGYEVSKILGYHVYMRYKYLEDLYNHKDNPKILVIQQKMIGDVLASTVICNNLKKMYATPTIDYAIYPFTSPVTENNPNIDNLVLYDPKYRSSRKDLLKFLFGIRKQKYDIVIDAYGKVEGNLITSFSGAKKRISFYKFYTSYLYTDTVKELTAPISNAGLAIDNRLELVKVLNEKYNFDRKPKLFMTDAELEGGKKLISDNGLDKFENLYMISLLGSSDIKTYPREYMVKLLDVIAQKENVCMIFNYMPSQATEALEVYNMCSPETQAKIRTDINPGKIRDFLSLLYYCKALIGNEGGSINMAKALNVPTFTVFSTWINKEAWNTFEDGKQYVSVHLKDYKPQLYGSKSPKEMKHQALELYKHFTPDLIIPALKEYLKDN